MTTTNSGLVVVFLVVFVGLNIIGVLSAWLVGIATGLNYVTGIGMGTMITVIGFLGHRVLFGRSSESNLASST